MRGAETTANYSGGPSRRWQLGPIFLGDESMELVALCLVDYNAMPCPSRARPKRFLHCRVPIEHLFCFMLNAHGLTCVRGDRPLFSKLDFLLEAGQWLHVRGENGAGKTSLLRMLGGLAQPAAGEIRWDGALIQNPESTYRSEFLFLGHHSALKEDLTARENLAFAAAMDGKTLVASQASDSLARFGLKGREDLPVRVLSAGQKRRVMLARLVTRQARLWILDEPFTALDVKAIDLLAQLVNQHLTEGGMAVLTSHQSMPFAGAKVVQL